MPPRHVRIYVGTHTTTIPPQVVNLAKHCSVTVVKSTTHISEKAPPQTSITASSVKRLPPLIVKSFCASLWQWCRCHHQQTKDFTHVPLTIWWRFKIGGFVTSIYFHVQAWPTWRMWRVLRGGLPHSRHRPSSAEEKFASISKHVDGKKGVNRSLKKTWKSNEWKHEFLYHKRLSALWNHIQRQWGPSGEEVTHVTLRAKVYKQFNAGKEKTENPHHPTTRTARGKLPTATGHTWSLRLTQASSAYRFSSTHLTKMISGGVANTW